MTTKSAIFVVARNQGGKPHIEQHQDHHHARKVTGWLKRWPEYAQDDPSRYDHVFTYIGLPARYNKVTGQYEIAEDQLEPKTDGEVSPEPSTPEA